MTDPTVPGRYEIRVNGTLDRRWSRWFEGLEVDHRGTDTVISGRLPDQAALHGLLNKIRDLDLFLISVVYLAGGERQPATHDSSEIAPPPPTQPRPE